jgi:RNA polymerase I-specific transcription initiation factor RRN6
MAESTLSHLNYGHAGTATFDIDSRHWSFARQFATRHLNQIKIRNRNSIDAIPAPIQFPSSTISTRFTDANANAKALLQIYPQLFPASDILPELAATSAAVLSAAQSYDPLVGSLYSTGSVTYASRSDIWENPRRIAATVTGEAANVLRLAFLHKEVMGWEGDKSVWIRGDTLRNTESGYWNEEAAPIQQVCFAQSEDRSSLLAVRLPTKTVIFRPFYSQRPEPARPSSHYHLPPSLIDPHPVLTLRSHQTGGSPHADVTFNPDFQLQFAVVDQSHFWSVWDLERGRKTGEYNLSCFVQGHVVPPEDTNSSGEDGWARVLWVGDVNTIMVCNRRHLSIIDITGGSFRYLSCPALISKRSSDWILDVQRHPLLRGRFFVLTSTELLLLAVTTASEARNVSAGPVGARTLLSWKHYRGMEDFTLSICVQLLDENGMYIALWCADFN